MTETEKREDLIARYVLAERCFMPDTAAALRTIFGDRLADATNGTVMTLETVLYDHGYKEQAERVSKMFWIYKITAFWLLERGYNECGSNEAVK